MDENTGGNWLFDFVLTVASPFFRSLAFHFGLLLVLFWAINKSHSLKSKERVHSIRMVRWSLYIELFLTFVGHPFIYAVLNHGLHRGSFQFYQFASFLVEIICGLIDAVVWLIVLRALLIGEPEPAAELRGTDLDSYIDSVK
jgi:hypothetical protein